MTFVPGLICASSAGSGSGGRGAAGACGGIHRCAGEGATDASTRGPGSTVAQPTAASTNKSAARFMVAVYLAKLRRE